jgi:dienelactone hydrolase
MRLPLALLLVLPLLLPTPVAAGEPQRDRRLEKPKDLNGYFPWTPPATLEEWQARRKTLREQVLVANGLWPLPTKTPLHPVIHGKIERDGYTVEKVFFASHPGHYVTGSLYRPTGKTGRLPGVLCPHGHWANGRFFEAGDKVIDGEIKSGAEKTREGAKYPLQARCAQLARLGCVVFHYDMVGYADSKQIAHREGFQDLEAELRLQSFLGLQTWNSIRALDFLTALPDVDTTRIGVTGASGGGTQTFVLCAVDDRPTVAFPAVMVSTAMQGGCVCENCSYLRVGTGNIELTGLFAPKPLGMSAALDWTRDIETKGLPELKALYKLYGAEDNVMGKAYLQFGHNYNRVARELMYGWFNKHLKLGHAEPISEQSFVPVPPKELSVWDDKHPLPADATDAAGLRRYLTEDAERQLQSLVPRDAAGLDKLRAVLGPALRTMIVDELPTLRQEDLPRNPTKAMKSGVKMLSGFISRKGEGERVAVAALGVGADKWQGQVVVWVHPDGLSSLWNGDKLVPAAQQIIDAGHGIVAVEVFRTGATGKEEHPGTNTKAARRPYAGYFYGYNRALLAERVHDILTAVAMARTAPEVKAIHLAGFGAAGPWVALARGLCGDKVQRTAVDLNGFRFEEVKDFDHPMMLPGALRYGGLTALVALAAPHELCLHNVKGCGPAPLLEAAYRSAERSQSLVRHDERLEPERVVQWLLR